MFLYLLTKHTLKGDLFQKLTFCRSGSVQWRAQTAYFLSEKSVWPGTLLICWNTRRCWQNRVLLSSCNCATGRSQSKKGCRSECGTWLSPCTEAALYLKRTETYKFGSGTGKTERCSLLGSTSSNVIATDLWFTFTKILPSILVHEAVSWEHLKYMRELDQNLADGACFGHVLSRNLRL